MNRPTTSCLALAFSFTASLTLAGNPTVASAPPDAGAAQPAPIIETSTIDDAATSTRPCLGLQLEQEAELFTPAAGNDATDAVETSETDVAPAAQARKPMRGFCRCTCSFVPNCSTNADCGGGLCLKGPTCC